MINLTNIVNNQGFSSSSAANNLDQEDHHWASLYVDGITGVADDVADVDVTLDDVDTELEPRRADHPDRETDPDIEQGPIL